MGVGYLTGQGGGLNTIKTIQKGSLDSLQITSSGYSIPISTVDLTKSIVRLVYGSSGQTDAVTLFRAEITTPSEIKIYRASATGFTGVNIYWEVIEFNNVKSLQKGTTAATTTNNTNNNVTISSVDALKTIIFDSYTCVSTSSLNQQVKGAALTNSTTIALVKNDTSGLSTHHWQVIEFR